MWFSFRISKLKWFNYFNARHTYVAHKSNRSHLSVWAGVREGERQRELLVAIHLVDIFNSLTSICTLNVRRVRVLTYEQFETMKIDHSTQLYTLHTHTASHEIWDGKRKRKTRLRIQRPRDTAILTRTRASAFSFAFSIDFDVVRASHRITSYRIARQRNRKPRVSWYSYAYFPRVLNATPLSTSAINFMSDKRIQTFDDH